jgi:hypothetical protein
MDENAFHDSLLLSGTSTTSSEFLESSGMDKHDSRQSCNSNLDSLVISESSIGRLSEGSAKLRHTKKQGFESLRNPSDIWDSEGASSKIKIAGISFSKAGQREDGLGRRMTATLCTIETAARWKKKIRWSVATVCRANRGDFCWMISSGSAAAALSNNDWIPSNGSDNSQTWIAMDKAEHKLVNAEKRRL